MITKVATTRTATAGMTAIKRRKTKLTSPIGISLRTAYRVRPALRELAPPQPQTCSGFLNGRIFPQSWPDMLLVYA